MRVRTQAFRRPLDQVFVAASHVAVCRALQDTAEGMSGRQVARQAGINHQTCAMALSRLEDLGIVRRQGPGQTQLCEGTLVLNDTFSLTHELAGVGRGTPTPPRSQSSCKMDGALRPEDRRKAT